MRRIFRTVLLLGALCAACSSPSPVDEIVASNLVARGGVEQIRALQSLRFTGIATASGGRVARVVRETKRPGFFRLEFSSQGTKAVFAHDGEIGWYVAPLEGVFEPQEAAPGVEDPAGVGERDIEGPLVDWQQKGNLVELVGRETLPGGEAFKLKVTLFDGSVRYDYIDVISHLIVRSDTTRTIRGHTVVFEQTFSDFRDVGGLVFPHLIETHVTDRPEVIRIVVETVEVNPELDDTRFRFPE